MNHKRERTQEEKRRWEVTDMCAASISPARCDLPNGHEGLHVRRGQIPETTVWWRCSPEDPVMAERERCADIAESQCNGCSIAFPCNPCNAATKIREGGK